MTLQGRWRRLLLAAPALLIIAALGFTQCRLAVTPDAVIARSVEKAVKGARSIPDVRTRLGNYTIIGEGPGLGFFEPRDTQIVESTTASSAPYSFHIVVGHHPSIFIVFMTAVEGEVVVTEEGRVAKIAIRRTTDAL